MLAPAYSLTKPKVAVFLSRHHSFHCAVAHGLLKQSRAARDFTLTMISTTLQESDVRTKVLKSVQEEYDIIISIGQRCTAYAKKALDEIGGHPLIFLGVNDRFALELVDSFETPGGYMTGVVRQEAPQLAVAEKIALLGPEINNIIIPYWPQGLGGDLESQALASSAYLRQHSFNVDAVPVQNSDQLLRVVRGFVKKHDVVLTLEGCIAADVHRDLSYICWERDALFCAEGLESSRLGAACAFGGERAEFAQEAYALIMSYHKNHIPLGLMPVRRLLNKRMFIVNTMMVYAAGFSSAVFNQLKECRDVLIIKEWENCPLK